MAYLNIGASNRDDAFYRYKMPRLITKIEGRGNGIKTNLVNMVDVAKALTRPPTYTTKYFGCELGAQSKFDEKTGTAIVNGAHDTSKLAGLLENFIKKYVQCYGCGNPETEIVITRSQLVTLNCAACGFVSDVDMRDKLITFILKNPPEQNKKMGQKKGMRRAEKERLKEGEALDDEMKHVKKETRKKKGHEEGVPATRKKASGSDEEEHSSTASQVDTEEVTAEEDDVHWQTDTSIKAAQQRIKEQLTSATSEIVMLDTISDLATDSSAAKIKDIKVVSKKSHPAKREPGSGVGEAEMISLKELSIHEENLKDFKRCLENGFSASELAGHLHMDRPGSSGQEVMNSFFEALFEGIYKGLAKEVKKKKLYLTKAITDERSQELLLRAIEKHFVSGKSEEQKEVALVLKMLYDLDILDEESILAWYDAGLGGFGSKAGQVKKFAKPFVEWLQNAESEGEE